MIVDRKNAFEVFVDEKIYVIGGCEIDEYPSNWIEVFDMKSQSSVLGSLARSWR